MIYPQNNLQASMGQLYFMGQSLKNIAANLLILVGVARFELTTLSPPECYSLPYSNLFIQYVTTHQLSHTLANISNLRPCISSFYARTMGHFFHKLIHTIYVGDARSQNAAGDYSVSHSSVPGSKSSNVLTVR